MSMKSDEKAKLRGHITKYLKQAKLMQLATVANGNPWVCNVWYVADKDMNIYWFSSTTRRHSKEVIDDNRVSAAICLPQTPKDDPRGIQLEGVAELLIKPSDIAKATALFVGRIFTPKQIKTFWDLVDYPHRFYRIKPTSIVLFDGLNYPDESRQGYQL